MGTTDLPLDSREYKLMLSTTRFRDRDDASREWMEMVARAIGRARGTPLAQEEVDKKKGDPHVKRRTTSFLDTRDNGLRSLGWILRVRHDDEGPHLTLKFRSPDRFIAAAKDVAATPGPKEDPKFEEDILPPFNSQFSQSNTIGAPGGKAGQVGDAAALFPVLGTLGIPLDTTLVTVDGLEVNEVVLLVGGFRFGDGKKIKMSQTFWYTGDTEAHYPMVAEFSFDYKAADEGEPFPLATVAGAEAVYRDLQAQAGWLDVAGTTKSSLVSGGV